MPGIGRFASADTLVPDPANPQSLNRYTYVLNSAVNRVDPTGHATCEDLPWECDSEGIWFNDGTTPTPSLKPPNNYEWTLLTPNGDGRVSWYDYPIYNDPSISHPDQLPDRPGINNFNYYQVQGWVKLNNQVWNYEVENDTWIKNDWAERCAGGFGSATQCVTPYQNSSYYFGLDPYEKPTTGAVKGRGGGLPQGQGINLLIQVYEPNGNSHQFLVEPRDECPGCKSLQVDILALNPLRFYNSYNTHNGVPAAVYIWVATPIQPNSTDGRFNPY